MYFCYTSLSFEKLSASLLYFIFTARSIEFSSDIFSSDILFPHLGTLFLKSFHRSGRHIDFQRYIQYYNHYESSPCARFHLYGYELLYKSSFIKFSFFIILVCISTSFSVLKDFLLEKCLTSCKMKLVSKRSGKLVFQRGSHSQYIGNKSGTRYLYPALFEFVFILIVEYCSPYAYEQIVSPRNWPLRDEFSVFSRFLLYGDGLGHLLIYLDLCW